MTTQTTTQNDNDEGFSGWVTSHLRSAWNSTGGKVLHKIEDAGQAIDDKISGYISSKISGALISLLEGIRSFFKDSLGLETFGNGGAGAKIIDTLEQDIDPSFKPAAPQPAAPAPAR